MMRIHSIAVVAAAMFGAALVMPHQAQAMGDHPGLSAPKLTESVACRTVRERVVRPGGRVIYRSRRVCSPVAVRPVPRCSMVRQRVVRPNGTVVYRSVRRCR